MAPTAAPARLSVALGAKPAAPTAVARPRARTASTGAATKRRRSLAGPLAGVCAMVDVRVGADAQIDCSDVVARKLKELGAAIVTRFCPKLTHMVLSHLTPTWKLKIAKWQSGVTSASSSFAGGARDAGVDGRVKTVDSTISASELMNMAQRRDLKIVSQLWVNACYVSKQRMEEKPFFPISKASDSIAPPRQAISSRHSLGSARLKRAHSSPLDLTASSGDENVDTTNGVNSAQLTTPSPAEKKTPLKPQLVPARATQARKRRALSMEPMASDTILKLLESSGVIEKGATPKKPQTEANATKAAELPRHKRRKSISDLKSTFSTAVTISQSQSQSLPPSPTEPTTWNECVGESGSESESEDKLKVVTEQDQPSQDAVVPKPSPKLCRTRSATALAAAARQKPPVASKRAGKSKSKAATVTTATKTSKSKPSPGVVVRTVTPTPTTRRRVNQPGVVLKSGIWSCSLCGCSNPRAQRMCRSCRRSKNAPALPVPAVAAAAASTPMSSPSKQTPKKAALPPVVPKKTPIRLSNVPTSAVKARPSPGRPIPAVVSPTTPTQSTTMHSAGKPHKISSAVPITPSVITLKTPHKPRISPHSSPSPQKPFPSGILLKRLSAGSPVSTPPTKRQRLSSSAATSSEASDIGTPQSVASSTRRKSKTKSIATPKVVPPTTSKKTSRKPRVVIAITGLDSEARGVIECAVHAIDASMSGEEAGHRKARVVKSLDYAAAVTHLIVGKEAKRTIKVLFAIARGAWILPEAWVFSSLDKERWLPEESFEMSVFGNQESRLHPESRQIFRGGKFYVGAKVEPSREVMQSLIQCAGGEVSPLIAHFPPLLVSRA